MTLPLNDLRNIFVMAEMKWCTAPSAAVMVFAAWYTAIMLRTKKAVWKFRRLQVAISGTTIFLIWSTGTLPVMLFLLIRPIDWQNIWAQMMGWCSMWIITRCCASKWRRGGDERMASTILFSIRGEYRINGCTRKIYWGPIIKTSFLLCGERIERLNKLF